MSSNSPIDPNEVRKSIESFVQDKFGANMEVFSHNLGEKKKPSDSPVADSSGSDSSKDMGSFDCFPKDIKTYLDRFIIGQDEAKKVLSIAVCDHYRHIKHSLETESDPGRYLKHHTLILGPTGVGKTYMVQKIAKFIGVPFVNADATRFSEIGYVGANVEDLIRDLVQNASGDIKKAEMGIVYLDEIDKLATQKSQGERDISGRGVQLGLLKLMEDSEVDLRASHDPASQIQAFFDIQKKGKSDKQVVSTKNILFITSGAFVGLSDIIGKRTHTNKIGFQGCKGSQVVDHDLLEEVITEDFISFGLEPEFVGRLPVRVVCSSLSAQMLFQIISSVEDSIVDQYKRNFRSYGIRVKFEDDALMTIASKASKEQTGARGLLTIFDKILRNFKFELPSLGVKSLIVTKDTVLHPQRYLSRILDDFNFNHKNSELFLKYEKSFFLENHIEIKFSDKAKKAFLKKSGNDFDSSMRSMLSIFSHALSLIKLQNDISCFEINENIINNPQKELEHLVKSSFDKKVSILA